MLGLFVLALGLYFEAIQHVEAAGNLVIVGGSLQANNSYIYEKIIEWAGGPGSAAMAVITAASTTSPENDANTIMNNFRNYGVTDITWIPIHINNKEAAWDPIWVAEARRMSGFFFGGGQQWRVMESMLFPNESRTPLLQAIQETYRAGAVMSGSSAGAATQNEAVVLEPSGRSYEGLLKGSIPRGEGSGYDLVYLPEGGMGSIKAYIIDSHFSERGREGRLPRLCWDLQNDSNGRGALLGIGLDEDTALAITNVDEDNAQGQVLGSNGVMYMDLTSAYEDTSGQYFKLFDVKTHYLTHGDRISLMSQEVTVDDWKTILSGNEQEDEAQQSEDIFRYQVGTTVPEYVRVAASLINSRNSAATTGRTVQSNPRFEVEIFRVDDSRGWIGEHPYKHVTQISYVNLWVDMYDQSVKRR